MHPTNADLKEAFDDHTRHDEAFQNETRKTDQSILDSLNGLHIKMEALTMQMGEQGERLDSIEKKMEPILELYEGLSFGGKAVKWTSGIVLAITIIVGAAVAVVKYIKG